MVQSEPRPRSRSPEPMPLCAPAAECPVLEPWRVIDWRCRRGFDRRQRRGRHRHPIGASAPPLQTASRSSGRGVLPGQNRSSVSRGRTEENNAPEWPVTAAPSGSPARHGPTTGNPSAEPSSSSSPPSTPCPRGSSPCPANPTSSSPPPGPPPNCPVARRPPRPHHPVRVRCRPHRGPVRRIPTDRFPRPANAARGRQGLERPPQSHHLLNPAWAQPSRPGPFRITSRQLPERYRHDVMRLDRVLCVSTQYPDKLMVGQYFSSMSTTRYGMVWLQLDHLRIRKAGGTIRN